jgi:hypothetical protein
MFYEDEAVAHGMAEAVLINYLRLFLRGNKQRGNNIDDDGIVWTYTTYEQIAEEHAFWSVDQVGRMVRKLRDSGVIRAERRGYDGYTWFSFVDDGLLQFHSDETAKTQAHHSESAGSTIYTEESLTFTKAVAGYFQERGLTPVDADLQANAFIEYWEERGGGPTPDKFKRHAATWLTNASKFGKLNMPVNRMTKDEFGEAQRQAHIAGKKFDTTGWKLEGDMWVKKS